MGMFATCLTQPAQAQTATAQDGKFTDSHGRTIRFRYALKESWDKQVPRGALIYFHGNADATEEVILNRSIGRIERLAEAQNLVPVVVASPESKGTENRWSNRTVYSDYTGLGGTRYWRVEDAPLVHKLIQSDFSGAFRVDPNRVVFYGTSQGTCFLNRFVQSYGEHYGGGYLGDCGCADFGWDPFWRPTEQFQDRFRVLIRSTQQDFLHVSGHAAYGYLKYVAGLKTKADLSREGRHCAAGNVSNEDAIDWLLDGTGLPEDPDHLHFQRISRIDHIVGITVDQDGALWAVRQPLADSRDRLLRTVGEIESYPPATVWRSIDRGETFELISQLAIDGVFDLDAVGEGLVLKAALARVYENTSGDRPFSWSHSTQQYRSVDSGRSFEMLDQSFSGVYHSTVDRNGHLYAMDGVIPIVYYVSEDQGDSWASLGGPADGLGGPLLASDPIYPRSATNHLFTGNWGGQRAVTWVGSTYRDQWDRLSETPYGAVYWATWDGEAVWGLARGGRVDESKGLFRSFDLGSTWDEVPWPLPSIDARDSYTRITALGLDELLIGGHSGFAYRRGVEWRHVYGGETVTYIDHNRTVSQIGAPHGGHHTAVDHTRGDLFLTDGRGIFRLGGHNRPESAVDGIVDTDEDGISDKLDAFPSNSRETADTDGDGIGNREDRDDDGDGVYDEEDAVPLDRFDSTDADGDGMGDSIDLDDDNDGYEDSVDAFPLDRLEQADSDGDGVGDRLDDDDDGDGVDDRQDAFPLYPHEWLDTDRDGIGDNIDLDDDNDGHNDDDDPSPKKGEALPSLVLAHPHRALVPRRGQNVRLSVHPGSYIYPPAAGDVQVFGHVRLGDGPDPDIPLMVDYVDGDELIYFDRNHNGNLTDDGPPVRRQARSGFGPATFGWTWLEVTYSSGETLPYGVSTHQFPYLYGGGWIGEVNAGDAGTFLVYAWDYEADGLFNGEQDILCIDLNHDGELACHPKDAPERFTPGEKIRVNGRMAEVHVAPSGHRVEFRFEFHVLSTHLMSPASHPTRQGFVRVVNRSDTDGSVEIHAFDDRGTAHGPVTLMIGAFETVHFNSSDLEDGNLDKGLSSGLGQSDSRWRLDLKSDLDIDVLSYIRTRDGFLTSMHDTAPTMNGEHSVPTFNPASNTMQVSHLRVINPGERDVTVEIEGTDDSGQSSGPVQFVLPARMSRNLSSVELETGDGEGLRGSLGDGIGKWRLSVASDGAIQVVSLLESPTGHLTNLSTVPTNSGEDFGVPAFPAGSHPTQDGFVRIINRSDTEGSVEIHAFDDTGAAHGPVTLAIGAFETAHFNSVDLEAGNSDKGLSSGVGHGDSAWRLELKSNLDIEVLSYIRTLDGFLTSMHDTAPTMNGEHSIPTFNPASNTMQLSRLRVINPGERDVAVEIEGTDDSGRSSGPVQFVVPARTSRNLSSVELETGDGKGLSGSIGDGEGKWRLSVASDGPVQVVSLLESPTGHLTNLSTVARNRSETNTAQDGAFTDALPPPFRSPVSQQSFYSPQTASEYTNLDQYLTE